jgi:hypothetical protein
LERGQSSEATRRRQAARAVFASGWARLKSIAPTTAVRQSGQASRYAWLAKRFQREREDLRALDETPAVLQFFSLAAGHYGDLAGELSPPNDKPLGIGVGSVTEEAGNYRLTLAGDATKAAKVRIILPNGDERDLTPAGVLLPILAFLDTRDSRFVIQLEKAADWFHYKATVPEALLAQTVARPRLLLSWQDVPDGDDSRLPAALGDELRLAANGARSCYLYVYNPTAEAQKLTVRGPGFIRPLATPLPPRHFRRVPLEGAPPKETDGWAPLDGCKLPFTLVDEKDSVLQDRAVTPRLRSPDDFLAEPPDVRFQPAAGELTIKLRPKPVPGVIVPAAAGGESATACDVRLQLPPERNPSLDLTRLTKIVTTARLPEQDELQIKGIRLQLGRDEPGWAALDVGGAPRAFIYALNLNPDGRATPGIPLMQPALYLRLRGNATPLLPDRRRPWPSSQALAFQIEIDNADDAAIEILLVDADGQTPRAAAWTRPSGRQRLIRSFPANNGLVFETRVGDWQDELPTKGLAGQYFLRARLVRNKTDIIDPVMLPVTLDDTPPADIAFVGLAEPVPQAPLLPLQARGEDRETGIREVRFFFGEPKAEQPPEKFTKGKWDSQQGFWKADLPMTGIPLGVATVSVQFVNGAGLTKTVTKQITVEAADPAAAIKPGRVEGTVVEGTQPQPNIEVRLLDDKGKLKDSAKTDMNGKFGFKKVPPGEYFLFCEKPATKREARKRIVVKEGEVEKADLDLVLK